MRLPLLTALPVVCLHAVVCTGSALSAAESVRPNIVVIIADDLGYADLSIQGCTDITTPRIDSIAKEGVRFTNAYVTQAVCAPSRAGWMTGRWQDRFGFEGNPSPGAKWGLPTGEKTIGDWMKAGGYATGIFGKWHLGEQPEYHPNARGFDEFYGFLSGEHSYFHAKDPKWGPLLRNSAPVKLDKYLTQSIADECVSFISRHRDAPFFLVAAFNAPHEPMHAPESYLKEFSNITDPRRRIYAAMVRALDDGVGTILDALRENGLEKKTLLIFLSDNGGPILEGAAINGSRNDPLRGGKAELWEGGIRVPFFMRWPGRLPVGKVIDDPVISLDILPTATALAGVRPTSPMDGMDLLPWLEGHEAAPQRTPFFWKFYGRQVVRDGGMKLIRPEMGKGLELYNLNADISETKDVASGNPEKVSEMKRVFDQWDRGNAKPIVQP